MAPYGLSDDEYDRWWHESGKAQLAEILYWVWDPIGVNGAFPVTRGEYDNYITPILSALKKSATPAEIDVLLARFETDQMGLGVRAVPPGSEPSRTAKLIDTWLEHSVGYWQDRPNSDWRHA